MVVRHLANHGGLAVVLFLVGTIVAGCPGPRSHPDQRARFTLEKRLRPARPGRLVALLSEELNRSIRKLRVPKQPDIRILYLGYTAHDQRSANIIATNGGISHDSTTAHRWLSVNLRVGDGARESSQRTLRNIPFAEDIEKSPLTLSDDAKVVRTIAWLATSRAYHRAVRRLRRTQQADRARREQEKRNHTKQPPGHKAPDKPFIHRPTAGPATPGAPRVTPPASDRARPRRPVYSKAEPIRLVGPPARLRLALNTWRRRLRRVSAVFRDFPWLRDTGVHLYASAQTRTMVTSESTVLQLPKTNYSLELTAKTMAPDGMTLKMARIFAGRGAADLPRVSQLLATGREIVARLKALRHAPLATPYSGPVIFRAQAAAVLFHEVLGHTLEGHRHDEMTRLKTHPWRLGTRIMPTFLSAFDDPRLQRINGVFLNGTYRVDEEGVRGRRVHLVKKGILGELLMSRRITRHRALSNGHGRAAKNLLAVARQSNLVVLPSRTFSSAELRRKLLREVRRQKKPFGLVVSEALEGKLTQSGYFWVHAVVVHQVFADGRPDRLVRGLQPVGTPAQILSGILAAGRHLATFNGLCKAESGRVLVSSTAPSVLIREIGTIRLEAGKQPKVTTLPPRTLPPRTLPPRTLPPRTLPPRTLPPRRRP